MAWKKIVLVIWGLSLTLSPVAALARSSVEQTVIDGAIGGALLGQVIGRDTEATLIGTAVGGMLGLVVGHANQRPRAVVYTTHRPSRRGAVECRDALFVAHVDGRPEQVWGRACRDEGGEWVMPDGYGVERIVVIEPRVSRPFLKIRHHRRARHQGRHGRDCNWQPREHRHRRH